MVITETRGGKVSNRANYRGEMIISQYNNINNRNSHPRQNIKYYINPHFTLFIFQLIPK